MESIVRNMGGDTRILVASIRQVESMTELMTESKMDTFTFSPEIARALFDDTLTETAAKVFEDAAQNNMAP
jgi:transaldolase